MHLLGPGIVIASALAALAPAPAPTPPAAPAERRVHTLEIEPGTMLQVKAQLAGRTVTFLVDTGASQNVLAKSLAEELGIEGHGKLPAMGVGSQVIQLAKIDRLTVGPWSGTDVMFALMDLSAIRKARREFGGILGIPFLSSFKWVEWELDRHTLKLGEYLPGETRPENPIEKMLGGGLEKMLEQFKARAKSPGDVPATPVTSGLHLHDAGTALRVHFGLPDGVGLVVAAVDGGSPAAAAGLAAGDLITRIDGEPARSHGQLDERLAEVGRGAVSVEGRRRGERQTWRVRGR